MIPSIPAPPTGLPGEQTLPMVYPRPAAPAAFPGATAGWNKGTPPGMTFDQLKKYIATAESTNNPNAVGVNTKGQYAGSHDNGLYQVNDMHLTNLDGSELSQVNRATLQKHG